MTELHTLGCARRSAETTSRWLRERPFLGSALTWDSFVQRLAVLHDQCGKASCEGQGHGQGIESVTGKRVSCVNLWDYAKLLQGHAGIADVGTRGEYIIEAIDRAGWLDYEPGEDSRPEREDVDSHIGKSLANRLRGHQRRGRAVLVETIDTRQSDERVARQVIAALKQPRTYVVLEGGTRAAYHAPPANAVLGPEYRGGDDGGHAERLFGWNEERQGFYDQGSWGDWTWCLLPNGERADGCCLLSVAAVARSWAIDVVKVLP